MSFTPSRFRYLSETDFVALKDHVHHLLNRAYFNLHGTAFPSQPVDWHNTIINAALEVAMDPSLRQASDKTMMHLFEDIISISQELHARAQEHLSKANSPVYLRAMALESHQRHLREEHQAMPVRPDGQVLSLRAEHSGTIPSRSQGDGDTPKPDLSFAN